jgi:VCBS repeat-containing protein
MKTNVVKSDADLKSDVLAELKYEPSVSVSDIGVLVKEGSVTLNGFVGTHGEKHDAVLAAKRVKGVRAIADDIEVRLNGSNRYPDGEIALAAANQIKWHTTIAENTVTVTVSHGVVKLEGEVEWWYQMNAASDAVLYLAGVKSVTNLLTIKPKLETTEVEAVIKAAFERNALLDAEKIHVLISGNKVVLSGKVRNCTERDEAERASWAASGVLMVDNQITVDWHWGFSN